MSSLILPYAGLDAGQPASLSPDYRSTVARSPRQAPIAQRKPDGTWWLDINLSGENETVFFDL